MTETFRAAIPRRLRRRRLGRQLRPPRISRFEDRYAARLFGFLDVVMREVEDDLLPNLPGILAEHQQEAELIVGQRVDDSVDRITRIFRQVEVGVAEFLPESRLHRAGQQTGDEINQANSDYNRENARSVLGVDVLTSEPWLVPALENFTRENVSLIRGATDEQVKDIEQLVFRLVQRGASAREIEQEIAVVMDAGKKRARLIARDQVAKFNGRLSQARQQQLGVTEYIWRTSDDERVRPTHAVLDNTAHSWDNPPVTVRSGRRAGEQNHPGQDIQCRCIAEPIFREAPLVAGVA